ncbi:MAG: zinc metalloprotease HtpX [Ktedonobacterales bacterium]|nr:zinc metalloprotease HtpX [Ktedonobacterales bacterium]
MTTRPQWYRPDRQLAFRMALTMFTLVLVYLAFVFVLGSIFKNLGFVFFFFIALIIAGAQFYFADKIALWSMNARIVTPEEAPELSEMVSRLAQAANLPMPRLAIVDTTVPNAFATGRNERNAVVCVTTGIMRQLTDPELEAVLAHELTHIVNRDVLVMSIAAFFSMVAGLLTRSMLYGMMWGGMGGGYGDRRNRDDNGGTQILLFLVSALVAAISFVLVRLLSRYRELAADRGSALITGAPQNLASALMKISGTMQSGRIPDRDLRQAEAVNALAIIPAVKGEEVQEIFSTHPSLQHRLEQLQRIQEQMESAGRLR